MRDIAACYIWVHCSSSAFRAAGGRRSEPKLTVSRSGFLQPVYLAVCLSCLLLLYDCGELGCSSMTGEAGCSEITFQIFPNFYLLPLFRKTKTKHKVGLKNLDKYTNKNRNETGVVYIACIQLTC